VRVGGGYGLSNDSPYFVDLNLDGLLDLYQEAAVYFQTGGGQVDPPPPHPPFHVRAVIAAPNPFRPRSQEYEVVSYTASARAVVEVSVYDVAGRMVRRLYSGAVQPGEHTVSWDGRDDTGRALASGVYFYTIESQGERTTGRIVILR
jgi:hypothetical protein